MNACEENNNRNNKKKNQEVIMKTKIKSVNVSQASKENYEKTRKCKSVCCTTTLIILGILNLFCGFCFIKYSLYEFLFKDRLNMRTYMPPYQLWLNPEPEVLVRMYIFNITNPDEYINGTDDKLRLQEIGPISYQEILTHTDVVFNENSTLSYTATKKLVFREDLNEPGILNKSVTVSNLATLGIAAYLENAGFFVNIGAKIIMAKANESVLRQMTVYDYLWNYTSDVLSMAKTLGGSWLVPVENMGVLYNIYFNYSDRLNVKMGPKYTYNEFFHLMSYNYRTTVPGFKLEHGDCNASILGATEGAIYPGLLSKDTVLLYWRKTLCRTAPLYFEEEVQRGPLLGYKYVLQNDVYDRSNETSVKDCYEGPSKTLPDGLTDLSRCFNNFPVAASKPHFYGKRGPWTDKLTGLFPNRTLHDSYIIVEPKLGIPLDQCARSQSNLVVSEIHSVYSESIRRFSNTIIPMFWIEIHQPDLTPLIVFVSNFFINILPTLEKFLGPIFIAFGSVMLLFVLIRIFEFNQSDLKKKNKLNILS